MSKVEELRRITTREVGEALPARVEDDLGETSISQAGYWVKVSKIYFDKGYRIRLRLFQNGEFVRHLDLSGLLARELWPILRDWDSKSQ